MSIFGKIMSSIFGGAAQAAPAPSASSGPASAPGAVPAAGGSAPISSVDVSAIMDKLADDHAEDLDWKKSIVDLMKLLNMDSGLSARKELAAELGYTGNTGDSASMNIWLHNQMMTKMAADRLI